jgi:oxalate decarboxylase/phosphoglucose isomerase-like protein (cupin superfamily)
MKKPLPVIVSQDMRPREGEDTAFKGGMTWFSLFDAAHTPTEGMTVGIGEIPALGKGTAHWHKQAELYYILEGFGHMEIDAVRYEVKKGAAVYVPGDAIHNIFNASDSVMKILYVFPCSSLSDVTYRFEDGSVSQF